MAPLVTRYTIDSEDRIRFVSREWLDFARENGARGLDEERVLGQELWTFVAGAEIRHLYHLVFSRVREDSQPVQIPFRCDSPGLRRRMQLLIESGDGHDLELSARLLEAEERTPVGILDPEVERGQDFLTLCSWCKRAMLEPNDWDEIEVAVERLGLFDGAPLPQLTHGICPDCFREMGGRLPPNGSSGRGVD